MPKNTPLVSAAAATGEAVVLDDSSVAPASITLGGRLEIRLPAQLGTGYSWALRDALPASLKPLGDRTERADGAPVEGGSDVQVFSFEAVSPGEAKLDFVYRRPFAPQDPPARRATFAITIRAR